jgi:putative flippase GtrA
MKDLIDQFKGKEHGPLVQFIKYGIAGGAATAVDVIIFYIMAGFVFRALTPDDWAVRYLNLPAVELGNAVRANLVVVDSFIAFLFSNLVAYVTNVKWVFESGRHKRHVELAMFYAVSGTSIAVGVGIAYVLIRWFGLTSTVAFATKVIAAVMINYVMRKFVIFKG